MQLCPGLVQYHTISYYHGREAVIAFSNGGTRRHSHIKMGSLHLSTIRQEIVASGHDSMRPAAAHLIDEKRLKSICFMGMMT